MSASTNLLSFSTTWFVAFNVFLMNVQLGRNYVQRDAVDHAAAVAADTAGKTYCDSSSSSSAAATKRSVQPVLDMVGSPDSCQVVTTQKGIGESAGRELDVAIKCRFACTIPIASQAMCTNGFVTFEKHQTTVAMGCDAK
jgi:hypothetical protein